MKLKKMYKPPHPGEVLRGLYLESLGLTVKEAALGLGVSRSTLSEVVNGHRSVTPDMALRLAKAFDTEAEMWLNMQKNYDLWHAEQNSKEKLKSVKRFHVSRAMPE